MNRRVMLVLGIRPDIIRASTIIRLLDDDPRCELSFVWSGQHYSDNLKDVFFRDLGVRRPDLELGCGGTTDAEITSALLSRLYDAIQKHTPAVVVFLGDTNTVVGSLAAAQCNVPIFHIEGCMRSYDWRMPEEKYRTLIDHLSDVIYAYLPAYKDNGMAEGIAPDRVIVTGNPIVDVLQEHYPRIRDNHAPGVLRAKGVEPRSYALMTAHRRENVECPDSLVNIFNLAGFVPHPVLFPASYRTQRAVQDFALTLPKNVLMSDPLGYTDFLSLLGNCRYVLTDSGTVVEEACVLQVPSVQMRRSTERPEVYDVGASVRFDPGETGATPLFERTVENVTKMEGSAWKQPFGEGRASQRIASDLAERIETGRLTTHLLDEQHPRVHRAMYGNTR